MKWTVPDFYPEFRCIGEACTDNCCIGWEIDIDPDTAARYRSLPGPFGDRLRLNIDFTQPPHFILAGQERCPFLNDRNLCDIYCALGEQSLSEICREHPRFHEWFGTFRESGVGLACPEAVRLLLQDSKPLQFTDMDDGTQPRPLSEEDTQWVSAAMQARESLYSILQNRTMPFLHRLHRFYNTAAALQDKWYGFSPSGEDIPLPTAAECLTYAQGLEPINNVWSTLLQKAASTLQTPHSEAPQAVIPDWMLEKIACYLSFRWLAKAAFDGELFEKAAFIVQFILLLLLLSTCRGSSTCDPLAARDIADTLRLLSKQLEYLSD